MKKIALILCAALLSFVDIEACNPREYPYLDMTRPVSATLYLICKPGKTNQVTKSVLISKSGKFTYYDGNFHEIFNDTAIIFGKEMNPYLDVRQMQEQLLQLFGGVVISDKPTEIFSIDIPLIVPKTLIDNPYHFTPLLKRLGFIMLSHHRIDV